MKDYEKLGVFYLGRYHDPISGQTLADPVLYNSNDLVTHALCVGMTGSGKTGLCVDIIEEAALDGIPAIVLDPKGDLANLLLTFPELRPEDFRPWINEDDARKRGLAPEAYAAQQAESWRTGLASWDQEPDRIRRLREASEFVIYTPGSTAGVPVSILSSFAAPAPEIRADLELLNERVHTTVSGLLGLIGVDGDPLRSRESVFLANILSDAWKNGRDLDLTTLMQEIQTPALQQVGAMDVESFYPAKERFQLALSINSLLASPGFSAWLQGEPLDIQRLYYTPAGKPRVAIFSIAHLNDAERMFFVTLLLNQLLGWMRQQSGTSSLRALFYMDEIFGYFPPVANPPSKGPLLTLLKQARAYGIGLVLATQNPVDLDYKGLANIGTWFLGRLQTDRDKQRVLDGLEGASAQTRSEFDRPTMERTLSALGNRVFLLHNVHEEGATLFESRWAMSYLRGPLTRNQIKLLSAQAQPAARPSSAPAGARIDRSSATPAAPTITPISGPGTAEPLGSSVAEVRVTASQMVAGVTVGGGRPPLPPAIPQFFISPRGAARVLYEPLLIGAAEIRYLDAKAKVDELETVVLLTPIKDDAVPVDWSEAIEAAMDPNDLEKTPAPVATFAPLAAPAAQPRNYPIWTKDFADHLFGHRRLTLFRSPKFGTSSRPGETEGDFLIRLNQTARERRDAVAAKFRAKYEPKLVTLRERHRRAEQAAEREAAQARSAKLSSALSFGTTLLGAFLGKKILSTGNMSRAGSALRSAGRAVDQAGDVQRAAETVEAVQRQMDALDTQFKAEVDLAQADLETSGSVVEAIQLRPNKSNIKVQLVALVWTPFAPDAAGKMVALL